MSLQPPLSEEKLEAGRKLWGWLKMDMALEGEDGFPYADALVICGNNLSEMAEKASQVYAEGVIRYVVCSGATKRDEFNGQSEAEYFAGKLEEFGVPAKVIIRESQATNTPENMIYSEELLKEKVMQPSRVILVTAAQAERRTLATAQKHFSPETELLVTSPEMSYEQFMEGKSEFTLSVLMGHVARMRAYAHKGDLAPQELTREALQGYYSLLKMGIYPNGYYTKEGELGSLAKDLEDAGEGLDLMGAEKEVSARETSQETQEFCAPLESKVQLR